MVFSHWSWDFFCFFLWRMIIDWDLGMFCMMLWVSGSYPSLLFGKPHLMLLWQSNRGRDAIGYTSLGGSLCPPLSLCWYRKTGRWGPLITAEWSGELRHPTWPLLVPRGRVPCHSPYMALTDIMAWWPCLYCSPLIHPGGEGWLGWAGSLGLTTGPLTTLQGRLGCLMIA